LDHYNTYILKIDITAVQYSLSCLQVSYEGLKTAGIDLVDAICIIFARNTSECFRDPQDYGQALPANISPDHLAFSASTIFNRFAISSGFHGRILPTEKHNVEAFIHVIKDLGVTESSRALRYIQEADCNACFREAAKNGTLPAVTYYFSEKYSHELEAELDTEICEFEEISVYVSERCDRFNSICPASIPGLVMRPCT